VLGVVETGPDASQGREHEGGHPGGGGDVGTGNGRGV